MDAGTLRFAPAQTQLHDFIRSQCVSTNGPLHWMILGLIVSALGTIGCQPSSG